MSSPAPKYDIFQAIADPTRRKVLELLLKKERSISQITDHFSMSRTAVVKHLHVLSEAKLIHGQKRGREKIYRLQPEPFVELKQWLSYYEQFWSNKLSILQHIVENDHNGQVNVIQSDKD